jgi:hypothetical protein
MNIDQIALRALAHFSPEERSIPDNPDYPGRNAEVRGAINGALEEMFGESSPWLRRDERGLQLRAPVTVSLTVTADSTAAVIDDWQDWMAGCTLQISGSAVDNQIRNNEPAVRLKYPHDGESGATTAIVYQDAVDVAADVLEINEPVRIDRNPIAAMSHPGSLARGRSMNDFGFHRRAVDVPFLVGTAAETAGRPIAYSVDTWSPDDGTEAATRLRLFPAPNGPVFLDYSVKLRPPVVQDISEALPLPVPYQFIDSIFIPMMLQRLAGSPFWRGGDPNAVAANYQMARNLLNKGNPRARSGVVLRSRF